MENYDPAKIEKKWQEYWDEKNIYKTSEDLSKPKYYCLEMFPYPSGSLHCGHLRNYAIGDTIARFKRMQGFNVLYPMGYDSFGLPAENAAIKHKVNPKDWTMKNIKDIKTQQKMVGFSYDWDKIVATCTPEYYKWNQWIFLKFFEKGLAYKKKGFVNWCPECITVLANEQVLDGKCWRCNSIVEQKELTQWYFKITEYAEELLNDIEKLENWPYSVKLMQKNWIGKSHGAILKFDVIDENGNKIDEIETFTTRADTVYGITYLVLAPEHPKIREWVKGTPYEKEVMNFIKKVLKQSKIERTAEGKPKSGKFIGKYFINPFTQEKCPLWVGDYVLYEYGTGAVMAVPAHDQRDFEFAKKYNLPIKVVITKKDEILKPDELEQAYVDEGIMVNSGPFNGQNSKEALNNIIKFAEEKGIGKASINYKLKDWLISRQRYWGTPIPIVYCENCGTVPVPYEDLPVLLPEDIEFSGKGNPIETSSTFMETKCPECGKKAKRETDTMDTFVDSSWYFLRYCSPKETNAPFDIEQVKYWMPVDQYIGGIEHACMHLIYSRFFTKALRDLGLLNFDEPFKSLLCQGMVVSETFYRKSEDGKITWYNPSEIETEYDEKGRVTKAILKADGQPVCIGNVEKMSKSKNNGVDPISIIEKYGADTARLFILFAAPPEKELKWSDKGIEGCFRFLKRTFTFVVNSANNPGVEDEFNLRLRHTLCANVTNRLKSFKFNTAISAFMEFLNSYKNEKTADIKTLEVFIKLLSPFAPHLTEELWCKLGHTSSVFLSAWPEFDEKYVKSVEIEIAVQVKGKLRGSIKVSINDSQKEIEEKARAIPAVKRQLEGRTLLKVIYVKGKIINFVVK